MRARIYNTVLYMSVAEIDAVPAGECILQDLHAGKPCLLQKLSVFFRYRSQVLGNHGYISEPFFQFTEKGHARAFVKCTVLSGLIPGGNSIILLETVKMINTQYIIQLQAAFHASDPPVIAVFFHGSPVINGIAPPLSRG